MEKFVWPKNDGKLFVNTGEYYEHAYFGWGNNECKYYGYIFGYKKAGDILSDSVMESQDIKKCDTLIFPVVFLYRQYLELEMKSIYKKFSGENKESISSVIKDCSHSLLKIWNKIKPILNKYSKKEEKGDIENVEKYIKQFHEMDKTSLTFRYSTDKNLNEVRDKASRINYRILKERMDELEMFFDSVNYQLAHETSLEKEFRSYN